MTIPNANIQKELAHLKAEYEAGLEEGYDMPPNQMPLWFSTKTIVRLTAKERGFVLGWLLRNEERMEEQS